MLPMFNSALYLIDLPLQWGQLLSDEEVNVSPIIPVNAKFTTDVHDRSAIFFFFEGFYYLALGVSAFFHLTGEISGFLPNFIQSEF